MPPKKGRNCIRCPADKESFMKCRTTRQCNEHDAGSDALWPGFPSDADSSFRSSELKAYEQLLDAAEAKETKFDGKPITKQQLQICLDKIQSQVHDQKKGSKGGNKPAIPKSSSSSSSAVASSSKTTTKPPPPPLSGLPSAVPSGNKTATQPLPKTAQQPSASVNEPVGASSSHEEPGIPSLQGLNIGTSEPFNASAIEESAQGFLHKKKMYRLRPEAKQPLPQGSRADNGHKVNVIQEWQGKMDGLRKQKEALKDPSEAFELRPGFTNPEAQKSLVVRSNHFMVTLDPTKEFYEYEIQGIPDNASRPRKRDLVETMMENLPVLRDQKDDYASDYKKKIVAWKDLFEHDGNEIPDLVRTLTIPSRNNNTGANNSNQVQAMILRLNFVRKLGVGELIDYVKGRQISFANTGVVDALNILISKGVEDANAQSIEVGTNRFYFKPGWEYLGNDTGLLAIRGYYASIRPAMGNVLLNVNTAMGAFYEPVKVSEMLGKLRGEQWRKEKFLKGVRVRIEYDRRAKRDEKIDEDSIDCERRRTKTIFALQREGISVKFEKDGRNMLVVDYLNHTYGLRLNQKECMVNCGNQQSPSWFPASKLDIVPYQLFKSKLNPEQVAAMIEHACREPKPNKHLILNEGLASIGVTENLPTVLKKANIMISRNMIDVPAFALKMPQIRVAPRPDPRRQGKPTNAGYEDVHLEKSADFGYKWQMQRYKPRVTERKYSALTYLIYHGNSGKSVATLAKEWNVHIPAYEFGQAMLDPKNSMQIPEWSSVVIDQALERANKAGASLVVLVLPDSSSAYASYYRRFKSMGDQVYGMRSVCIAEDKIRGKNSRHFVAYLSGVALKLNLKLGNWNWELPPPMIEKVMQDKNNKLDTLILGADVTHPGAGSVPGTPSIAAVTGSVDGLCGRMPGSMRRQEGKVEMIAQLKEMVIERLRDWYVNRQLNLKKSPLVYLMPQKIIYYRDGVSESQWAAVKALEIPQIKAAWAEVRSDLVNKHKLPNERNMLPAKLCVTTIIVSKRHHTRFYPTDDSPLRDRSKGNLKPGVVVESGVTSPYWHDFYLNSHIGLQGTVRPCHYIVLEDEAKHAAAALQQLTFNLCHMYQRAQCAVSYATPTYYADRLCERGRHYLSDFFDGLVDAREATGGQIRDRLEANWFRGNPDKGAAGTRQNPWHSKLDGTMFWL